MTHDTDLPTAYDFVVHIETLGGSDTCDLSTEAGLAEWTEDLIQDDDEAIDLADRIAALRFHETILVNESDPEWVTRYSRLSPDSKLKEVTR
jgi:hypothetical protein